MDPLFDNDSNNDALALLKAKRSEELVEPTEELEEEAEPEVVEAETEEIPENDIPEVESEEVEEVEDDGPYVYLIGDEEVTEAQILEWKNGGLKQSDYTKKTMALADERKVFEAKTQSLSVKEQKLDDLITALEGEISGDGIDWDELMENDPSRYLKEKANREKKEKALGKAKTLKKQELDSEDLTYLQGQQAIVADRLGWQEPSKQKADLVLIEDYVTNKGFDVNEINRSVTAWQWISLLDAAKYHDLESKEPGVKKKVSKAPKVMKPTKARAKPSDTSIHDKAKKVLSRTGSDSDALKYLKSRRSG